MFLLAHWLAIEGKQPTINENPEIISKADQTADPLDPVRRREVPVVCILFLGICILDEISN